MFLFNNAIVWSNFQMSGGLRRLAWVCAAVAVLLPALMFGHARLDPDQFERTLAGWYLMLGFIQGGLLLFGMPSRVHAAIRRDRLTAKILESHRLMPVPAAHAVVGYLVGPNILLGGLVATIFAIGLSIAALANQDWRGWIALHAAGAGIGFTLCCLMAFFGNWVPRLSPAVLLLILVPGGVGMLNSVPAFQVMVAPFGRRLLELQRGEMPLSVVVAVGAQVVLSLILFVGAARRYRRDDVPALGLGWGLALLVLWVGLTLLGTRYESLFRLSSRSSDDMRVVSYVLSLSLSMLLCIGPIAGAAAARQAWTGRRRVDPYFDARPPAAIAVAAALTLGVMAGLLLAAPAEIDVPFWLAAPTSVRWIHYALTFAVIAAFGATIALLAHAASRLRVPPLLPIAAWVVLTWAIPPMLDGVSAAMASDVVNRFPRPLGAVSPPFALLAVWIGDLNAAAAGLIAQAASVPLLMVVWELIKRRQEATSPPTLPQAGVRAS